MELPDGWTTNTVRANEVSLQCHRIGGGPPVVMAHGLYDNDRRWIPLAEDLSNDFEVVTYDARGHGQSDAPESGYGPADRVSDLCGVVDELGLDEPVLLGHSIGAATVAWVAAEHPDLPRGLVLEDPVSLHEVPDIGPDERAGIVQERLKDAASKTVEELIEEHYSDVDRDHARRLARASHECSTQIAEIEREGYPFPLREIFPKIECKTLILRSDADVERRVKDLEAADSLRDGRLVHIPGATHYIFRDEYDAAYAELRTFLHRVQTGT